METVSSEATGFTPEVPDQLYEDRVDAGRRLAELLRDEIGADAVVVAIASGGGIEVGAEIARELGTPLDVVAVRRVRHPSSPDVAIGAAAPDGSAFVSSGTGLTTVQVVHATARARAESAVAQARLHTHHAPLPLRGRTVVLVDDGIATAAKILAATRWARAAGAVRVVAAAPVASTAAGRLVRGEADLLVCPHEPEYFGAVGIWYASFEVLDDEAVREALDAEWAVR